MKPSKFAARSESANLRRLAMNASTELMFTQNSAAEAEQSGITRPDCLRAIATGGVVKSEQLGPDWRRTVRGKDMDGNAITIVITVVSTMDGKRKRIVVLKSERSDDDVHGVAS
jgi:hypothetical protein